MSLPYRLYRLARWQLRGYLGVRQGADFLTTDEAREELEAYLAGRSRFQSRARYSGAATVVTARPHPLAEDYQVLGAPVGADSETLRRCWRRLVREVHPDRFPNDSTAQRRAADRLRRVNEAYSRLIR